MRAGSLRHLVTIQSPITTKTGGVASTIWEPFRQKIRASIEVMKSFDKSAAQSTMPGADVTIGLRYIAGLTGNMRIVGPDGTIYSILGTPNDVDGRHREMVLTCQTGVKTI